MLECVKWFHRFLNSNTFEENTAIVMAVDARPENNQAVIDEWTWVK